MTAASTVTDEAVEAAERAYMERWRDRVPAPGAGMRAALEAAVPLLAPQPVASQERVAEVLYTAMCKTGDDCEDLAAALLAAGVFVATQPVEVVVDHRPGETCSVAASVDPDTGFAPAACPHVWEEANPGMWLCKECGADVDLRNSPDWRPQPVVDREALLQLLDDHAVGRHVPQDKGKYRGNIADAVLALVNGSAK